MSQQPDQDDHANTQGECDKCGQTLYRYRGEANISCQCGAEYNCGGQRLRDDWRGNQSNWDEDVSDMEGFEDQQVRADREDW